MNNDLHNLLVQIDQKLDLILQRLEPTGDPATAREEQVLRIGKRWQEIMGYENRRLTKSRKGVINARLKDGFSEADWEDVLQFISKSSFHRGKNPTNRAYDDLVHFAGSTEKFERNLDAAHGGLLTGSTTAESLRASTKATQTRLL
jgi:hypothetical protein